MFVAIVLSIAFPVCFIVILIGCLDCLVRKRRLEGFRSRDTTNGQHSNAFSVDICDVPNTSEQVTIEPLPDILSKVSVAPPLRPQITFVERGEYASSAPLISVQRSFPRDHLTYLNEIGSGWFGKAIESEAIQIVSGSHKSHVVVRMLKDDASKLEQKQFLDEVHAYRCLDHANLMSLLGQCTEAAPFLVILEFAAYGNLKSFLVQHSQDLEVFVTKNRYISLALDAAAGLACLHRHDYIHNDLAARNCLVMSDYTLKIGDYGISDNLFKNEYYSTGTELLPIRWMAPETLIKSDGAWTTKPHNKTSDVWSFGILLWEICSVGERPYDMLTDDAVLQGVIQDRLVLPSDVDIKLPLKDKLWSIMTQCWQDSSRRLDVVQAYDSLEQLLTMRLDTVDVMSDFDQKWNQLKHNQARGTSSDTDLGSRIALAGSFATDDSSSPPDKPSLLDGDTEALESIRSGDLIVDVGDTFKSAYQSQSTVLANLVNAAENPGQATIQHKISSSSEDQVFVENEFTNTSVSQSHLTPIKSFDQTVGTTGTPAFHKQSSSSDSYMPDSYISAAQTMASERHISPIIQEAKVKDINSVKNDLSLDVEGQSFHKLSSGTQETSVKDSADKSNFDSHLQTDDEDFSEFVRTSPSAPSLDFTDFASADNNISAHNDLVNKDLQFEKVASSDLTGSGNVDNSLSKFDNDINAFSDFVASDPPNELGHTKVITPDLDTTPSDDESPGPAESFIRKDSTSRLDDNMIVSDNDGDTFSDFVSSVPTRRADSTDDDARLDINNLDGSDVASQNMPSHQDHGLEIFSQSGPESQNQTENLPTSVPDSNRDLQVQGSLTDFEVESQTSSVAVDFDVEQISMEKVEADHNQNIFLSEQFPSNLSSLTSDMSLLIHDANVETSGGILPMESKQLEGDTDVQQLFVSTNVTEPFHSSGGIATDVLEERKPSPSLAGVESNSSLESFDLLDEKFSSVADTKSADPAVVDVNGMKNDNRQESGSLDVQPGISFDLLDSELVQKADTSILSEPVEILENRKQTSTEPTEVEDSKPLDDLLSLDLTHPPAVSHTHHADLLTELQKSNGGAEVTSVEHAEKSPIDF